jgi:beta-phosphoglucomutase
MEWVEKYALFLFDLDGLLVNTEEIHYRAYKEMCKARGYTLPWSFKEYFNIAQQDAKAPERAIYAAFPSLYQEEPDWKVLYQEKKSWFLEILKNEPAPLLEGVDEFLLWLEEKGKKRAVVTHSARELADLLRQQNPILQTIPNWFTREDYNLPKPSPDGYLKAIDTLLLPGEKCIGFEDSLRGMKALMATCAYPVYINSFDEATRHHFQKEDVQVFRSFLDILHA